MDPTETACEKLHVRFIADQAKRVRMSVTGVRRVLRHGFVVVGHQQALSQ